MSRLLKIYFLMKTCKNRPHLLIHLLQVCFTVYDAISFMPNQLIASPSRILAKSKKIKVIINLIFWETILQACQSFGEESGFFSKYTDVSDIPIGKNSYKIVIVFLINCGIQELGYRQPQQWKEIRLHHGEMWA